MTVDHVDRPRAPSHNHPGSADDLREIKVKAKPRGLERCSGASRRDGASSTSVGRSASRRFFLFCSPALLSPVTETGKRVRERRQWFLI